MQHSVFLTCNFLQKVLAKNIHLLLLDLVKKHTILI